MTYSIFSDAQWLYPDSPHSSIREAVLDAPRGGHAGFYILGDEIPRGTKLSLTFSLTESAGIHADFFELLPVVVNENTSATLMTTTDYESCKDFVTRQAPFAVYDALQPFDGVCRSGRVALYVRIGCSHDMTPGTYEGTLSLRQGEKELFTVPVSCTAHRCRVPALSDAGFSMLNFFNYDGISSQHGAEPYSDRWWELYREYVKSQLDMRCTHIMLPSGEPVRDENGVLVGFDFSNAERAGQIARQENAPRLCGGHIAHWNEWTESEYFPTWDSDTGITTLEGYLQVRMYFSEWARVVERNGWEHCMTQALADEPQVHNAGTYRILAGIFRKFLPGIPIIDAVETVDLGGGIDIWVPKQDTYEKWREDYEKLKAAGETFWFYTCAFPAGVIMNRSMDLPLTASRAVLWMGAGYRLSGFLHWGFNYYIGADIWNSACCPHKGALLPAGDAHIVYPGSNGPIPSMRYEAQRSGAEECELLQKLSAIEPEAADAIIASVCTSFRDYTRDSEALHNARKQLLLALDVLS